MGSRQTLIRHYRPDDLGALYDICVRTADHGRDATALYRDQSLPGHIYAAPYGLFEPALAFVAEDAVGVGGYIVGALDSPAFEARLERDWWPRLRKRYPEPPPAVPEGDWTPDQRAAYRIHHPWHAPGELTRRYPSHLHINLVPRLQGHGHGTRLIAALVDSLRGRGSAGVHLNSSLANTRAAAFYRHTGFCELSADGGYLFGMPLR